MQPNDIIRVDLDTGATMFWEVQGVYLGGLGQEGVVHLLPLGIKKNTEGKTLVPNQLLATALQDTNWVRLYSKSEIYGN